MEAQPNLDELYDPPAEMIQKAVFDRIVDFHEAYIKAATFFCLATGSDRGLDASPRGGPPGFVRVLDPHTLAFADWPGNNRIESMRNLGRDDHVGMLFLFPGLEVFLRVNGRGRVSTDLELRQRLVDDGKVAKVAILIAVDEVLFHCGRAINRAKLWQETSRLDRRKLPSPGQIMTAIAKLDPAQAGQIDARYDQRVRNDLY